MKLSATSLPKLTHLGSQRWDALSHKSWEGEAHQAWRVDRNRWRNLQIDTVGVVALLTSLVTRSDQVTPQPSASIMRTGHCTTTLIVQVPKCDKGAKQQAQAAVTSDLCPCRQKSTNTKKSIGKSNEKKDLLGKKFCYNPPANYKVLANGSTRWPTDWSSWPIGRPIEQWVVVNSSTV